MSFYEIVMLICFGSAWPFSIYKSYNSRTNKGKSLIFLIVIIIGYGCGVLHKINYNYDNVVYLYAFNSFMVMIDVGLYFRNMKFDRQISEN